MKIINLPTNPNTYNCNAYLILGSWNKLDDVNALIDTGSDGFIVNEIEKINTGVGKRQLDKIIITHNHFDHTGGIKNLKEKFKAEALAFNNFSGIDRLLEDGEFLKLGDCKFEVMHTPGHSSDSICLYCQSEKVLFTGDLSIRVYANDSFYTPEYIQSIEKLAQLEIKVVYPGHGALITESPEQIIKKTLKILNNDIKIV
jgi:glyoxylase-like metal-dependent hydrolase (beta-lactamase superfamily II)